MRYFHFIPVVLLALFVCCRHDKQGDEGVSSFYEEETGEVIYKRPSVSRRPDGPPLYEKNGTRIHINHFGSFDEVFNDSNYRQYEYAEKLGIRPLNTLGDAYNTTKPIIEIKTNENYVVQELTHSMPYLVPEAAWLLDDIATAFIDTLKNRGADGYKIMVTSVLRSPYQVNKLRRVNVNAKDSSTHKFGTTFDISYNKFYCADSTRIVDERDLKHVLGEVLLDMRKQGRCMVKYERKSPCFHITVTKPLQTR